MGRVIETGERGASALGGQTTIWRLTTAEELSLHLARKAAETEHGEGAR